MRIFFILFVLLSNCLFAGKITVATLVSDDLRSTVSIGTNGKRAYCKKHGYDFVCERRWLDQDRSFPWSKILVLLNIMNKSTTEWIFWSDAESMITNTAINLEDFINPKYDLVITADSNQILDTGEFFIRNCEESKKFLTDVYAYSYFKRDPRNETPAFILELNKNENFRKRTKIAPQRLFNSYAREIFLGGEPDFAAMHLDGDFIVHFPPSYKKEVLKQLFGRYKNRIVDDTDCISLDCYLSIYNFSAHGFPSVKSRLTPRLRMKFVKRLQDLPRIEYIAETGLNTGHSMESFLKSCKNLKLAVSFDTLENYYTSYAVEFFTRFYKNKFTIVDGDPSEQVLEYAKNYAQKFDLIYVDGSYSYEKCLSEIINCKNLAHKDSLLWINGYLYPEIKKAIDECVSKKIIKIIVVHKSEDRSWVEAVYLN